MSEICIKKQREGKYWKRMDINETRLILLQFVYECIGTCCAFHRYMCVYADIHICICVYIYLFEILKNKMFKQQLVFI